MTHPPLGELMTDSGQQWADLSKIDVRDAVEVTATVTFVAECRRLAPGEDPIQASVEYIQATAATIEELTR